MLRDASMSRNEAVKKIVFLGLAVAVLGLCVSNVSAFNISLVYPATPLFSVGLDAAAKQTISKAAADISAAITTNLAGVTTDTYVGDVSGNTVTHNWTFNYQDPLTGSSNVTVDLATIPANTVRIQVGARSIAGSTLGVGGPGGMGLQVGYSYFNANQLPSAAAIADSKSEVAYKRGGGPVIGDVTLSQVVGGVTVNTSVDFGIAYGSLAFDWDGNNNGVKDTDAQLSNYWHFDYNTAPAAGKNDLYSVALHEMLHALGIGASNSWEQKVSGTTWTGANVISLMGSGAGLIAGTQDHIAANTMSTNAYTGLSQEAVMDPNITTGTRKYLTALDLAFLRDIGYSTIDWVTSPSSPADFDGDGDVDAVDLARWRGGYGTNANGDADGDDDTDGRDFLIWQREYTGAMLTANVVVPEPSAAVLCALSGLAFLARGCHKR